MVNFTVHRKHEFSFSLVTVLTLNFSLSLGNQLNISWALRKGGLQRPGESKQLLLISSGINVTCDLLLPLGTRASERSAYE